MDSATAGLEEFVRDGLSRGLPRSDIESAMLTAGWTAEQAKSALGAFASVEFPVPVPRPRPYLSARETFLYLVLFSVLYLTAYHLGALCFEFINRAFPDPSAQPVYSMWRDQVRFSAAALVVGFPLFAFMSWFIGRALEHNPMKRLSAVRRWLTYLTLFLAVTILACDLIALVYNLLGGELTMRFLLKIGTVALIAGSIFGYYLGDLRGEERT
jgi:Domain of unknown function (DUF5671)